MEHSELTTINPMEVDEKSNARLQDLKSMFGDTIEDAVLLLALKKYSDPNMAANALFDETTVETLRRQVKEETERVNDPVLDID